jgi:hypothetical protein
MFVDCGDLLMPNTIPEILYRLQLYPNYYIFLWAWINENTQKVSNVHRRST